MQNRHSLTQVVSEVADGIQLGVFGLAASIHVRELGNRSTAQDADPQAALFFGDHATFPG